MIHPNSYLRCLFAAILLAACQNKGPLPLPTASFTFAGPFTAGDSTWFTNESTNATSYSWDFGDGTTSTDALPVHVYQQPGRYTVQLAATNLGGTQSQTKAISLFMAPAGSKCNCKIFTYSYTTPRTRLPDEVIPVENYGVDGISFDRKDYNLIASDASHNEYRSTVFAASTGGEGDFIKATDSLYITFHSGGISNPTYVSYSCKRK